MFHVKHFNAIKTVVKVCRTTDNKLIEVLTQITQYNRIFEVKSKEQREKTKSIK